MTRRRQVREGEPSGGGNGSNARNGSPGKERAASHSSRSTTMGNLRAMLVGMALTLLIIIGMARVVPSQVEKLLGIVQMTRPHGRLVRRAPKRKTKMACVDKAQKA